MSHRRMSPSPSVILSLSKDQLPWPNNRYSPIKISMDRPVTRMKIHSLLFLVPLLTLSVRAAQADDPTVKDEVKNFYGLFESNSDDQTHFDAVCHSFLTQVPQEEQADVLADMLNHALASTPLNRDEICNVILFLQNLGKGIVWNQHLSDTLWSLSRTQDQYIRDDVIRLLGTQNDPTSKQLVIEALNDPMLRYHALSAVTGWNDAIPALQSFIQNHQFEPAFASSIRDATYALHGLQNNRSLQDYVDHFYGIFNTPPSDVPTMQYPFGRDVPIQMQSEVLDQILDRALSAKPNKAYVAVGNVLQYRTVEGSKMPISPQFENALQTLAHDSYDLARRDTITFLGYLNRSQDFDLILSALNDPSDEVRGAAVKAIWHREDAKTVFKQYISKHQRDHDYKLAVQNVQRALVDLDDDNQNGK